VAPRYDSGPVCVSATAVWKVAFRTPPIGRTGDSVTEEKYERLAKRPRPGDFAVVDTRTGAVPLTRLGRTLSRGGFRMFDHAVICSRVHRGKVYVVEAMPTGAQENVWQYDNHDHLWSTGIVRTSTKAGKAALTYVGKPYSWRDYAAIAAHSWHLWAPGLGLYMRSTRHLIGSQLVDRAQLDAGVHLFADRRWRGYVRPSDLADLILEIGELTPPASPVTAKSRVAKQPRAVQAPTVRAVRAVDARPRGGISGRSSSR
jgi:hypothetical protein